jgi:hypothetical protein
VFIKVVGTSFTEMFAANDWKPFQSCWISFCKSLNIFLIITKPQRAVCHVGTTFDKECFGELLDQVFTL